MLFAVHMSLNGGDFGDSLLSFFCPYLYTQKELRRQEILIYTNIRISKLHYTCLYADFTKNHEEANILLIIILISYKNTSV